MWKNRLFKILAVSLMVVAGIVLLVIVFISPITKYLVEKYDTEYTGREVVMDWAYVNPFTGYLHFSGLKIMEQKSDSIFVKMDGLSLDFAIWKAIGGEYEVSRFELDKPWAIVKQDSTVFNFSDLITKFSAKDSLSADTLPKEPVKFNILNIAIRKGEFHFRERKIPIVYFIKNVDVECSGKRWNSDETDVNFALEAGIGSGRISGTSHVNLATLAHKSDVSVRQFNLEILNQYLKEISSYGTFRAMLDADVHTTGNFNDPKKTDAQVRLDLANFHFGKNKDNDYAAFDRLHVKIKRICPSLGIFNYDTILLQRPYFKFERYDSLDNVQTMFGTGGKNVVEVDTAQTRFNLILEIAHYIQDMTEDLLDGNYSLNRLAVTDGNILYNDYTPREKFSVAASPFGLFANHISKQANTGNIRLQTGLKPYGNVDVKIRIYPKRRKDFNLSYHVSKIPVALFNPFVVTATSFPMERGKLELKGNWNVKGGMIQSDNKLTVIDPKTGKRVKKSDTKWIPVPLILAVVRERGNVIDYSIPITGNLNDPKFNVWDPVLDVLLNIFIKPATVPYGMQVRSIENAVEKSLNLKWELNSPQLPENSGRFVERLARFAEENPKAVLHIQPIVHEGKEKEAIVFYEAKKAYYLQKVGKSKKSFGEGDSISVEKLPNKDPGFVAYLNKHITDKLLFTVQHKSLNVVGENRVEAAYERLMANRKRDFLRRFDPKLHRQLDFAPVKNMVPFNGYSLFEISYEGDFPEALRKDYNQYQDLNDDLLRKRFKKKRTLRDIFF